MAAELGDLRLVRKRLSRGGEFESESEGGVSKTHPKGFKSPWRSNSHLKRRVGGSLLERGYSLVEQRNYS